MMISIGNFFFRYRNGIFPVAGALLFIGGPRLLPSDQLATALGFVMAVAGLALRCITVGLQYIKRGGLNRQVYADTLVQGGMFAHCRNPLYVGNLLGIIGLGLVANSLWFACVGLPFFVFAYLAIVAAEENFLRKKFGAEFEIYCHCVSRWGLNLAGFGKTWKSMEFHWQRVIVKEYGSIFLWIVTACVLLCQRYWRAGNPFANPAVAPWLWLLAVSAVTYAVVRYLKKSRILHAD